MKLLAFRHALRQLNTGQLVFTFCPLRVLGLDREGLTKKSAANGRLVLALFCCQELIAV